MRWKWKLRILFIIVIELPILLWLGTTMNASGSTLLAVAGGLAAFILVIRIVRPALFALLGLWLVGIAGGTWYLQAYLPATLAFASASVLSTAGCRVAYPIYFRALAIVLRRHV